MAWEPEGAALYGLRTLARGCIELADRLEEPNLREALLKTARDWMRDVEALRQTASSKSTPARGDDDAPSDQRAA
jgi:hypothetical protein